MMMKMKFKEGRNKARKNLAKKLEERSHWKKISIILMSPSMIWSLSWILFSKEHLQNLMKVGRKAFSSTT